MRQEFASSRSPLALLMLLMSTMPAASLAVQEAGGQAAPSVISIDCRLYRRSDRVQPILLDCRPDAVASYVRQGYVFRRQALLLMPPRAGGRPVWTLDETTLAKDGSTDVNILPREAFANLADMVSAGHVLSLRRLRQRRLDLAALARLPQLRHLELAESNATCLFRDMFNSTPALTSLRLVDNELLACMQPDTFADLADLTELSLVGSSRLKSLYAAAAAPSLIDLRLADLQPTWNGSLCRASRLRRLHLDRLPQRPFLLAGLTGLQSLRVDAHDDEMLKTLVNLAPAACAQWPDGRLELNGISLAKWTLAHLGQDFAEFCEFEPETASFSERSRQLCSSAASRSADSCFAECGDKEGGLLRAQPRNESTRLFLTESPTSPAATAPATKDTEPAEPVTAANGIKSYSGWHVDQRGVLGTALLTAGAFLGGVLAAAYCCSSGRLGGGGGGVGGSLKQSITGSLASSGGNGSGKVATILISNSSGGCDLTALEADEPIRLIGYSAKSTASLPALDRPLIWAD